MSRFLSNVNISTSTFYTWLLKTNDLLHSHSNEIVTAANTAFGANTSGNVNVVGFLSGNLISTPIIRGGATGNSANISTLTVGFANSSNSSNLILTGHSANVTANTLNIFSNTLVESANILVNTAVARIISNTVLSGNSTSNNVILTGNTTATVLTINGNTSQVNTTNFNVNSVSTVTGNTTLKANTTVTNITLAGNTTHSNLTLSGNLVTISSNLTISGAVANVYSNTLVECSNAFVNTATTRVISNTTLSGNSTTNNVILTGNATATALTINGNTASINTSTFTVNSVSSVTGNTTVKANTTVTNITVQGNTTHSNLVLNGNLVTISTNLTVTGFSTNLYSNNINLLSNTLIESANLFVNTAAARIISNTTLSGNSTVNNVILTGNTTATVLTINGNTSQVNTTTFNVNSVSTLTGNTSVKANTSLTNISVLGNGTTSNVTLTGNLVTISSNATLTGNLVTISGNLVVDTNTLFVDSVNDRVGVYTTSPQYRLHVVDNTAIQTVVFENSLHSTMVEFSSNSSGYSIYSDAGELLRLSADNNGGTGFVLLAANGNIGLGNSTPAARIALSNGAVVYANGVFNTFNDVVANRDVVVNNDLFANNLLLGGNTTSNITVAVGPIAPPNTSYSAADTDANTVVGTNNYNYFTSTTPQRIDIVKVSDYQAVKYTIQAQDVAVANEVFMTEVSMVHGFNNAHSTQYGTIFTNTSFIDITSAGNSTYMWLLAAPTSAYLSAGGGAVSIQFRGTRQRIK